MIGRLIKSEQLNAKLITIEHNENWSNLLSELLKKEDLEGCVKVVYAPLTECDLSLESNKWYDREAINKEAGEKTFDLMIVDGPPAFNPAEEKSRYPAVPYIFDKLQENCSIYLDDASRSGERFVLQAWEKKFSIKFQLKGGTLAHFTRGKSFFTEPFLFF
jgi:predicted O-methyltransferase YrrM